MALSENTGQLDDLLHLLRALSKEDLAAVRALVERLTRREMAVKEATAPCVASGGMAKVVCPGERQMEPAPMTPQEALDFLASGPSGFLPGELDSILADIQYAREMELRTLCQPTC